MTPMLPREARVVIIGGGIVGCSVAYHLTKLGITDVLLLERKKLTSGTTWHAAGLVRSMLYSANLTRLAQYTVGLYRGLEAETGQATGFRQRGSISIALNPERWEELKRGASMANAFGIPAEAISPARVKALWPLLEARDVVGAIHFPTDGQTNPTDTTMALARGARLGGARLVEDVTVTGILTNRGRAAGVTTQYGPIKAETVVNCAGMWAREVGRWVGVDVPLQACEHFYVVTEPIADLPGTLPVLRVMDECTYYKEEAGKLLLGCFEPRAKPWAVGGIPDDFCFGELPEDVDHFEPILTAALGRVPALSQVGIRKFFNGPESFTPDQRYLLGEAPFLGGFFVAAGFNSIGIQSAGGAGKALAEWIVAGAPPFDLSEVDIRRVMPHQNRQAYLVDRVSEALGLLYAMHWPHRQFETARGVKRSPFFERQRAAGACFGEVAGWERPNWFGAPGTMPRYEYSFGRQNWFPAAAAEAKAAREAVALFDLSSFYKLQIHGPDAEALLQRLSAGDVGGPVGRARYTLWLNEKGGIETDLTVTRLGEQEFLVVGGAAMSVRDRAWLERHRGAARIQVDDITSANAVVGIVGPRSRTLLERVSDADFSDAAFPFGTAQQVSIGYATALAIRLNYAGELGWELYIASEQAAGAYDALVGAGAELGLKLAGMHALDSLRLERGFRHWGHDIGSDDTPFEAGLSFCVALDKPVPFIGRDALLAWHGQPLSRRLVSLRLDDAAPLLYHDEPIWRDGQRVGRVSSGAYGHTLGSAVALGWVEDDAGVDTAWVESGRFEIEVALTRYPAKASLKPFFDPAGLRQRG
jgi:glycine cleavage system aminomethyltransferase T/glycine/D-amino acid oxidase-like deaminating enzyme